MDELELPKQNRGYGYWQLDLRVIGTHDYKTDSQGDFLISDKSGKLTKQHIDAIEEGFNNIVDDVLVEKKVQPFYKYRN